MIVVTGAGGKTGRAVVAALAARGAKVRAWARREAPELTAAEVIAGGDLRDPDAVRRALRGAQAVYHICPNMHPDEAAIGMTMIAAARAAGLEHFVYHSVLHPQTEAMPHHWNKLRVEEALWESGLNVTILQPAAYMQNLLAGWPAIVEEGRLRAPYPVATRLSLVDVGDVAEVVARVITEPGHRAATYELAGTPGLTQADVAATLGGALGRPVRAEAYSIEAWETGAREAGLSDYAVDTLKAMFRYYTDFGLTGSPNALRWLLGREPTSLAEFARRSAAGPAQRRRAPRLCEG